MRKFCQKGMSIYSQRGVSLYITIMILAIILSIVFGLSAILMGQFETIKEIEYSTISIYAADTGIERALKDIYKGSPADSYSDLLTPIKNSNPGYETTVSCCEIGAQIGAQPCALKATEGEGPTCPSGLEEDSSCAARYYCIRSTGTYKGVKRAIETSI